MKTQHTPGPWTFDEIWHRIKGPHGEEIAAVHSARRGNRETAHENARLIASAPDLLAQRDELAAIVAAGERTFRKKSSPHEEIKWLARARAALAEVKGQP